MHYHGKTFKTKVYIYILVSYTFKYVINYYFMLMTMYTVKVTINDFIQ